MPAIVASVVPSNDVACTAAVVEISIGRVVERRHEDGDDGALGGVAAYASILSTTLTGNEVFTAGQNMISEPSYDGHRVLPIAVLVVWATLSNVSMLLILGSNIVVTLALSFSIMYPISLSSTVYTTVPSMMMSVILAMSIDYSLFLLARFQEEMVVEDAASTTSSPAMLDHAGYNVFVSGTCLMLCFIGLLCFPVTLIFSLGVGAAVAVCSAIVVNLTLTPVLLYTFPGFFSDDRWGGWDVSRMGRRCRRRWREETEEENDDNEAMSFVAMDDVSSSGTRERVSLLLRVLESARSRRDGPTTSLSFSELSRSRLR